MVVDLPAPLGPRKPCTSPARPRGRGRRARVFAHTLAGGILGATGHWYATGFTTPGSSPPSRVGSTWPDAAPGSWRDPAAATRGWARNVRLDGRSSPGPISEEVADAFEDAVDERLDLVRVELGQEPPLAVAGVATRLGVGRWSVCCSRSVELLARARRARPPADRAPWKRSSIRSTRSSSACERSSSACRSCLDVGVRLACGGLEPRRPGPRAPSMRASRSSSSNSSASIALVGGGDLAVAPRSEVPSAMTTKAMRKPSSSHPIPNARSRLRRSCSGSSGSSRPGPASSAWCLPRGIPGGIGGALPGGGPLPALPHPPAPDRCGWVRAAGQRSSACPGAPGSTRRVASGPARRRGVGIVTAGWTRRVDAPVGSRRVRLAHAATSRSRHGGTVACARPRHTVHGPPHRSGAPGYRGPSRTAGARWLGGQQGRDDGVDDDRRGSGAAPRALPHPPAGDHRGNRRPARLTVRERAALLAVALVRTAAAAADRPGHAGRAARRRPTRPAAPGPRAGRRRRGDAGASGRRRAWSWRRSTPP
jgi:hypothetical protein